MGAYKVEKTDKTEKDKDKPKDSSKDVIELPHYLSRKEAEIKFIKVGGISKIKSVKTNKKLIINVDESSSLNLSDNEKKEYEYVVF